MQLSTKFNIKIKSGFLPHLVNEICKKKCFTRNVTLLKKEDNFDIFDIEVMYSNFEIINTLVNKIKKFDDNFHILSSETLLEKELTGGMLKVSGKLPLNNFLDYEMNVLGAAELAIDLTRDVGAENVLKYSGISKNIGTFCGISSANNPDDKRKLQQLYSKLERDSIIINSFTGFNSFPVIVKLNQFDDFIKILQSLELTFSAIRISHLEDIDDIQMYERIYNEISLPVLSKYYDEIPLNLLISITHLLKKNNLNFKECNVGLVGINITSLRMARLLIKQGFPRILGCDNNIKLMHVFEREGGLATVFDNIVNNCDLIIIVKDQLNDDDLQKFSSGQVVISLLERELDSSILKEKGVLEFLQSGWMDISALFPGILKGLIESKIKFIDDLKLLKLLDKIISEKPKEDLLPKVFTELHERIPLLIHGL